MKARNKDKLKEEFYAEFNIIYMARTNDVTDEVWAFIEQKLEEAVKKERRKIGLKFIEWLSGNDGEDVEDAIERITGVKSR